MSSPDVFNRSMGKNYSVNDLPLALRNLGAIHYSRRQFGAARASALC